MKRIYVVDKHISGPFIGKIRWLDDRRYEKKLKFAKEQRDEITSIRNRSRWPINRHSVTFHGLRLTNTPKPIEEKIQETDQKLKQIDPSLSASVIMIPVDEEAIKKGKLHKKLCYAIIHKIVSEMERKVFKLKSDVFSERSIESLNKMLDDCSMLNFMDADDVTREIESLRDLLRYPTAVALERICVKLVRICVKLGVEVSPRVQALIDVMKMKNGKQNESHSHNKSKVKKSRRATVKGNGRKGGRRTKR